jgi:subtilase family serine protease
LETLEDRLAPSVSPLGTILSGVAEPDDHVVSSAITLPNGGPGQPAGFSPGQISQAYGFNQITFNNGAIQGNGNGQTIAIIDAYNQPNISSDLQTFDATYGIAAPPSLTVVNQNGGTTLPAADANWGLEISLDVEWAHAMAPQANILLVEANTNNYSDLLTAINYARQQPNVSVVSMSWGGGEWGTESAFNNYFTTPAGHVGITFVASSGDNGSSGAPEFPSVSPNVLAVGGTQLSTDGAGNYLGETGWSGSGGGISAYFSQPSYQQGVVTQSLTQRTVPDVAYNGSDGSPFAVYDSSSYGGWIQVYGTSAGAPQWAALVAIADQGRALAGQSTLDGATQTLSRLYQLPRSDFNDVTTGNNGGYSAGPGYDLVTGLGSPRANLLVAGLVSTGNPAGNPPWVVNAASATANPVTGTTTNLSVLGGDNAGANNLTYTWSVLTEPAAAAPSTFSVNGSNAAHSTIATFHAAGTYTFQATILDPSGLAVTSNVVVTVNQTATTVMVSPGSVGVSNGAAVSFTATTLDQFGHAMNVQPNGWSWHLTGSGTINANRVYTAPSSGSGTAVVQATSGTLSGQASVSFSPTPLPPPTPPSPPAPVDPFAAYYQELIDILMAEFAFIESLFQSFAL